MVMVRSPSLPGMWRTSRTVRTCLSVLSMNWRVRMTRPSGLRSVTTIASPSQAAAAFIEPRGVKTSVGWPPTFSTREICMPSVRSNSSPSWKISRLSEFAAGLPAFHFQAFLFGAVRAVEAFARHRALVRVDGRSARASAAPAHATAGTARAAAARHVVDLGRVVAGLGVDAPGAREIRPRPGRGRRHTGRGRAAARRHGRRGARHRRGVGRGAGNRGRRSGRVLGEGGGGPEQKGPEQKGPEQKGQGQRGHTDISVNPNYRKEIMLRLIDKLQIIYFYC